MRASARPRATVASGVMPNETQLMSDGRFRTLLAVTAALAIEATCATSASGQDAPFPFRSFERKNGEADVEAAKQELLRRLPVGSPLRAYEQLFKHAGGSCLRSWEPKDPNWIRCEYSHGWWLVSAEWFSAIQFDPKTRASTDVSLGFGITGL